ncbi:hypothetical protein pEaSNUABM8_00158 [Erwinia phage pEa_SNUABM_8]|nr:hypothetical protein pEaSNUABM8_00158 [Erwinia phage pEa_SNUABM_8]QVW54910.1 hypothetical protein pEaSNUABM4_00157 [Erwinia phage pEa_SNUABM_4]
MLKPRKCRKLLLIISPQLKAAIGKKLFAINGEWSGKEFIKYVNASPSIRPQLGMVARKLGTIYARHMEKHFGVGRKADWTKIRNVGEEELPQRQTGQKALAQLLAGKPGFARSKPTSLGGGNVATRLDFNYHDHVPNTDQKHYFATPEKNTTMMQHTRDSIAHLTLTGRPPETVTPASELNERLLSEPRSSHSVLTSECRTELSRPKLSELTMSDAECSVPAPYQEPKEGELLSPELEIKGVHLKQSKLDPSEVRRLVEAYGDIAEKQLIEKFFSEVVTSERDDEAFQKVGRACLFRMLEAK